MTVKQLIEELQKLPPDLIVYKFYMCDNDCCAGHGDQITFIEVTEANGKLCPSQVLLK